MEIPAALRRRAEVGPDGALWVAHLDATREVAAVDEAGEPLHCLDELMMRHLVDLAGRLRSPEVIIAISRADGTARAIDRRLRRQLPGRLTGTPTRVVDVVVVPTSVNEPHEIGLSDPRPVSPRRTQPVNGAVVG